mmetsp:Transcript_104948/g.208621  ORF Transcript_104948/g.208621 Transcript_104948/m.208621 type:complete len:308 (+) Transcript_104948:70-993(+)
MGGVAGGIVFAAPEPSYHPLEYRSEFLWVPRLGEVRTEYGIPCLLLQNPAASFVVIYFHANAEDLGQIYILLRFLRTQLGVHVLAVEYPGYGVCSGTPSEEKLLSDAETVMEFVRRDLKVPQSRVLLMGRSMGGGPAIYLASQHACAGLVTMATFSSLRTVASSFATMAGWLVDDFDNAQRIRSVRCPTLIVHGDRDTLVPLDQAAILAQACGADVDEQQPVTLHIIPGRDHNNLDIKRDIIDPVMHTFPGIDKGNPLSLEATDVLLEEQSTKLAADVLARVPFRPGWVPDRPPFSQVRMFSGDQEI